MVDEQRTKESGPDDGSGVRKTPEEVRAAKIVLKEPWQRWGLVGMAVVLCIAVGVIAFSFAG